MNLNFSDGLLEPIREVLEFEELDVILLLGA